MQKNKSDSYTLSDEIDASDDVKKFWKHLKLRDYLVLFLIVVNIAFYFKLKDYDTVKQQALNGNGAFNYINQMLQANQPKQ